MVNVKKLPSNNVSQEIILTDEATINSYKKQLKIASRLEGQHGKIDALENLALIYEKLGQYQQALDYFEQQLKIVKEINDEYILSIVLGNIGNIYIKLGEYEKAKEYFDQQLNISQSLQDNLTENNARENLASIYYLQGNYQQAEKLYHQSLLIKTEILGDDNLDIASSYNNLAQVFYEQGRYTEAEPLYLRSLAIREEQLGANHPDTAQSLNNLAGLYESQGRYTEAKPLYLRSLAIYNSDNSPRISQTNSGSGDNVAGNKTVNNDNRQITVGKNYIENVQGTYIELQNNYSNSPNTETTQATKTIKIFLASSSELKSDRDQFEQFIYRETKHKYIKEGIFLELVMWEDFIDAMSQNRFQDEYNKAISECDVFVMLFFIKVGKYIEEEFETAFKTFKDNNKPKIYTYFKDVLINISEIKQEQIMSLFNFKKKLSELGHFYTSYSDINDLKYQFSQQLIKILLKF